MPSTFEAAPGIRGIDTVMCGREGATSAYLVEATEPALVETGPTTSVQAVRDGLDELGVGPGDLAHIIVTHVHLDHAGGAGALAPHFPEATVWVHRRGAPHLVDPSKLEASAARVYGPERLRELFGPIHPLPAERVRGVDEGDKIDLGSRSIEVLYTPGHASHHVCLVDSDTGGVFTGDALGVFLPDVGILRPATPPPEFDLDQAVASVQRVAAREPPLVLFSHFGAAKEATHLCQLAIRRLRRWTEVVERALEETDDLASLIERLRAGTASEYNPATGERRAEVEDRYELLSSYEMNAMGLKRYVTKRGA